MPQLALTSSCAGCRISPTASAISRLHQTSTCRVVRRRIRNSICRMVTNGGQPGRTAAASTGRTQHEPPYSGERDSDPVSGYAPPRSASATTSSLRRCRHRRRLQRATGQSLDKDLMNRCSVITREVSKPGRGIFAAEDFIETSPDSFLNSIRELSKRF